MSYNELKRWLSKQGCTFDLSKGKGSHATVYKEGKRSTFPMHGSKEVPTGLLKAIKKDLGL